MELPEYYVSPKLYTMDGLEVKFNLAESIDKGEFDPTSDLRSSTSTLYFDGVPAGNDQIVLRLYPDDLEESVQAEFTIDLTTQTATPSTTYDDGVYWIWMGPSITTPFGGPAKMSPLPPRTRKWSWAA